MDTSQPGGAPALDQNDKIIAALCYPISFIVSLIVLLTDMKNKPFMKYHAIQAIIANIAIWVVVFVLSLVLSITVVGLICVPFLPILWVVTLYWAYKTYQGEMFTIPVITDFMKNQHWV